MICSNSRTQIRANEPTRGVTLLVAVILSSVVLSVAISLLDVAYKQQLLASTAKQSQYAFYSADSAMECALYADQKQGIFVYDFPGSQGNTALDPKCANLDVTNYSASQVGNIRKTEFDVPCPTGPGVAGHVVVYKADTNTSATCSAGKTSCIYATGYSSCSATDPRRIERGLKVLY